MSEARHRPAGTNVNRRLYVRDSQDWQAHVKQGWEKEYCYLQEPDQEHFHLLINGEIYLQRGHEKYCLNCALRMGTATFDRSHWQRGSESRAPQ